MRYLLILLTVFLWSCNQQATQTETTKKLFTQIDSTWFEQGDASWLLEAGVLTGSLDSGAGFVMTERTYDNYRLTLEFKPDSTINSGIFVRCLEKDISATDCYEINIWDLHPNQDFRTGAVVTRAKPLNMVYTLEKWNQYVIECKGDSILAWINETPVVKLKDPQLTGGFIALQAAGSGSISFRNVEISELK